jgi:dienelactone hydrolase
MEIEAFKNDLDAAGADYQFVVYEGAKHSFTNPDAGKYAKEFGMDIAYNPEADQKSWQDMAAFLKKVFK